MANFRAEVIEKYQLAWEQNPDSRIFAPLAEAYRSSGMLDAALETCQRGLRSQPQFAGGWLALGKIYLQKKMYPKAVESLEKACQLSPDNISAHLLLADTWLRLKKPQKALRAYKQVLLQNPQHAKATHAVQKLEALTAQEYDSKLFQWPELKTRLVSWQSNTAETPESVSDKEPQPPAPVISNTDRYLSLVDALIARRDFDKAWLVLKEAQNQMGFTTEIQKRHALLIPSQMESTVPADARPHFPSPTNTSKQQQIARLKGLLLRIKNHEQTA